MTSTTPIQRWLAAEISQLDSVQRVTLGTEGQLVVYSWRGVIVHVHIVDSVLKPRSLKKIVQEATRVGIGSMFILNAALLPPDGARLVPDEWLSTIHALTDNKIYAYRIESDEPHLFQVHFKMGMKGEDRVVWYGPDIHIGRMPFYRHWVKTGSLKGDFLIANFEADPFWHNREYRSKRAAADQQQRAQRANGSTRYEYGYRGASAEQPVPQPQTRLERCYAELGLHVGVPCDEVKTAFRKLARELHPDVSALPKHEAETRFHLLNEAYTFIRDNGGCE